MEKKQGENIMSLFEAIYLMRWVCSNDKFKCPRCNYPLINQPKCKNCGQPIKYGGKKK